jgi:PadR family transcriptional regulator, regulatory protein PadR
MPDVPAHRTMLRAYWRSGRRRLPRSHRRVMMALLADLPRMSGYPLCRLAQVGSGTVYSVLARMERIGWVDAEWETPNPLPPGNGRRRFYRLTPKGRAAVTTLLDLAVEEADRDA